jgi:hypothetical protein
LAFVLGRAMMCSMHVFCGLAAEYLLDNPLQQTENLAAIAA